MVYGSGKIWRIGLTFGEMLVRMAIMKLEIDITDQKQLVKAKADLTQLLAIVDFAISQKNGSHHNGVHNVTSLLPLDSVNEVRPVFQPILDIIARLPDQFTTSDVIVALGENGKRDRPLAKSAITDAVERDVIRIVELGKGRRPTTYSKVLR